jgi:hypothetical protein
MHAPVYDVGRSNNPTPSSGSAQTNTYSLQNASATGGTFNLTGGIYLVSCIGTGFGTVTLQKLGPDSTTWQTAATAFAASNTETAYLPPGQYRWAVSGASGVYTAVERVPLR